MATTATLVTLSGKAFPFIGVGVAAAQLITQIPSAEIVFTSPFSGNAITVAGAGEDQSILVNCPLPRSFCYVLVEATARITSVAGADWDKSGTVVIVDSASVPETVITADMLNSELAHILSTQPARQYEMPHPPSKVIVPLGPDDANLSCYFQNVVIDGEVGVLYFYARFLRYDRNQAQYWQVNTPVLVR